MNNLPALSLLVLRSADVDGAVLFYEALGARFQAEQHGSGPRHFAAEWGGLVLEIYPESEHSPADRATRLGFIVDDFDDMRRRLVAAGGTEHSFDPAARRTVCGPGWTHD